MDKDIASKWAARLLKRADLQGAGRMFDGEKFCALGELCELHRQETGDGEWIQPDGGRWFYAVTKVDGHPRTSASFPPPRVREWAGMYTPYGTYGSDKTEAGACRGCVMRDNDTGTGFEKIAAKIVKYSQHM
jgi:hypothetical protein